MLRSANAPYGAAAFVHALFGCVKATGVALHGAVGELLVETHARTGRPLRLVQHVGLLHVHLRQVPHLVAVLEVAEPGLREILGSSALEAAVQGLDVRRVLAVVPRSHAAPAQVPREAPRVAVPDRQAQGTLVVHLLPEGARPLELVRTKVLRLQRPGIAVAVVLHELQRLADVLQLVDVGPAVAVSCGVLLVTRVHPVVRPTHVVLHREAGERVLLRLLDARLVLVGKRGRARRALGCGAPRDPAQVRARLLLRKVVEVPQRVDSLLVLLAGLAHRVVDLVVPDVEVLHPVRALLEVRYPLRAALRLLPLDALTVLEGHLRLVRSDPTLVALLARLDRRVPLVALAHVAELAAPLGLGVLVLDQSLPLVHVLLDAPHHGCRDHAERVPGR